MTDEIETEEIDPADSGAEADALADDGLDQPPAEEPSEDPEPEPEPEVAESYPEPVTQPDVVQDNVTQPGVETTLTPDGEVTGVHIPAEDTEPVETPGAPVVDETEVEDEPTE